MFRARRGIEYASVVLLLMLATSCGSPASPSVPSDSADPGATSANNTVSTQVADQIPVVSEGVKSRIIGSWHADIGVTPDNRPAWQQIEFYPDGTVTQTNNVTSFVGDYRLISDDTIRIDWKTNSSVNAVTGVNSAGTEVFHILLDGDILTLVSASGSATQYLRQAAVSQTAEARAALGPELIQGTWRQVRENRSDGMLIQFRGNGTFVVGYSADNQPLVQATGQYELDPSGKLTTTYDSGQLDVWPFWGQKETDNNSIHDISAVSMTISTYNGAINLIREVDVFSMASMRPQDVSATQVAVQALSIAGTWIEVDNPRRMYRFDPDRQFYVTSDTGVLVRGGTYEEIDAHTLRMTASNGSFDASIQRVDANTLLIERREYTLVQPLADIQAEYAQPLPVLQFPTSSPTSTPVPVPTPTPGPAELVVGQWRARGYEIDLSADGVITVTDPYGKTATGTYHYAEVLDQEAMRWRDSLEIEIQAGEVGVFTPGNQNVIISTIGRGSMILWSPNWPDGEIVFQRR